MSGILDLLNSDMGKTLINGVSNQTDQPQDKTQTVLTMALPVLMAAMKRNASSTQGAEGLLAALNSPKHDGSILNNIGGLFNEGVDDRVLNDGSKILGHVLGGKQANVENTLSAKSGMDIGSVTKILKVAAPILMGMLAKKKNAENVDTTNGLESMLDQLLGGSSARQEQSFLESILDADKDGSVIDDVAGMFLGSDKKNSGNLDGMIGGFFS